MGRKRKLHLGNTPIGGAPVKSRRLARSITSQYHVIQNERSLVTQDGTLTEKEREQKLQSLEKQMEDMGGTNRYQQASIISTQHFKTSKWVASTLTKLYGQEVTKKKLKVLEVGAINTQLQQYNWMEVRAIDLNSQHPSIEECDFFTVEPEGQYEVVVCSMVSLFVRLSNKQCDALNRADLVGF
jgi:25S rRNA (adenine2142-N1)-methyltransferase